MKTPMTLALTWKRLCLAASLLFVLAGVARAQDVDATAMIRGGLEVLRMIDAGNTGELWDGAAPGARKRVTRDEFVRQVTQARTPLGAPQQRAWLAISRQAVTNEDPELAGQYIAIVYETRFAKRTDSVAREQLSFHLGQDGTWRLSGYVVR